MTSSTARLTSIGLDGRDAIRNVAPVRPGNVGVPLLAELSGLPADNNPSHLAQALRADAERARESAVLRVISTPSSTTLAALAQAHAALGERISAVDAARRAIAMSVGRAAAQRVTWLDPSSVRISVEVLLRFDEGECAYQELQRSLATPPVCLSFASAALAIGKRKEAEKVLDLYDSWTVDAFRGYLHTRFAEFEKALRYLRRALQREPNDIDSLFNLAITWEKLGMPEKATHAALRASRIGRGRRDITLYYLELLVTQGKTDRLAHEFELLTSRRVVMDAGLLEVYACLHILQDELTSAADLFRTAADAAHLEGDHVLEQRARTAVAKIQPFIDT